MLAADQHVALAVRYVESGLLECAAPAAVNDVWWRGNHHAPSTVHTDPFGVQYQLLARWNVNPLLVDTYGKAVDYTILYYSITTIV